MNKYTPALFLAVLGLLITLLYEPSRSFVGLFFWLMVVLAFLWVRYAIRVQGPAQIDKLLRDR